MLEDSIDITLTVTLLSSSLISFNENYVFLNVKL